MFTASPDTQTGTADKIFAQRKGQKRGDGEGRNLTSFFFFSFIFFFLVAGMRDLGCRHNLLRCRPGDWLNKLTLPVEDRDGAVVVGDDDGGGHAEEHAVLDDAGDPEEAVADVL
jgi:hypothetical protein